MSLFHWTSSRPRRIAVVGMAKNAGKTVTLNALIAEAASESLPLGLTSIGRDGEREDRVTHTEKPSIYVEEGTLVATAAQLFNGSKARLEVLEVTDHTTPLGDVVIGRALTSGHVELAGPVTSRGIRQVTDKMLAYGAYKVLVDGAIDRVSSASPAVCEACILSTGAVLSRDLSTAVRLTRHQVELLSLPSLEEGPQREVVAQLFEEGKPALLEGERPVPIEAPSALLAGRQMAAAMTEATTHVIIPGALVEKTLRDLFSGRKRQEEVTVVVRDGTRIFLDPYAYEKTKKAGLNILVLQPIVLLGLTANPMSPEGYYFQPERFIGALREALDPLPVEDVLTRGEVL